MNPELLYQKITDTRSKLRGVPNGIRVLKSDDHIGVISSARFARSGVAFILAAELRGILPEIIKRVFPRNLKQKLPKIVRVVLIDKETSRRLNVRFRKKRKATNVLSFWYDASYGEILLCLPVIRADARAQHNSCAFQMTWMIVHGMIHLSGLHHEHSRVLARKVARIEHEVLSVLGREKTKKLKIKMQNKSAKF